MSGHRLSGKSINELTNDWLGVGRTGCDRHWRAEADKRPYRRGHNRCKTCGWRLSGGESVTRNVFTPSPLFQKLAS
jgi:hypothetical protein